MLAADASDSSDDAREARSERIAADSGVVSRKKNCGEALIPDGPGVIVGVARLSIAPATAVVTMDVTRRSVCIRLRIFWGENLLD